jgi:hypothetical protein
MHRSLLDDHTKHTRLLTGFSPPPHRYGCHQIDVRWVWRTECFS